MFSGVFLFVYLLFVGGVCIYLFVIAKLDERLATTPTASVVSQEWFTKSEPDL